MSSVVPFETLNELFINLSHKNKGKNKTVFARKPGSQEPYVSIVWETFTDDVNALASYFISSGVEKGDRIAILSENRYEWAVVDMAIQLIGAVNVALYTSQPSNQCEYILKDSEACLFFVSTGIQQKKAIEIFENCTDLQKVIAFDEPKQEAFKKVEFMVMFQDILEEGRKSYAENQKKIEQARKKVKPEDMATLIYTSGTTGKPKGAIQTHHNIVSNVLACLNVIDISEEDRTLSFLPLCHSFERTGGYYAVLAGGAEIYYAESVDTVAKNMVEAQPTIVISVPRLFEKIYNLVQKSIEDGPETKKKIFNWAIDIGDKYANGKRGLISLQKKLADKLVFDQLKKRTGGRIKFFVSGGAALSPDIGTFFMAAGLRIIEGYGLTETSPVIAANHLGKERIGTVGYVIPGVTIGIQRLEDSKIIAELSGEDYPSELSSVEGEILCKGPNVMKGYWNKPEATAEVIDSEGWFHTGDIGRFNEGYLQITDRLKHMIVNAGGKNIYPGPIEDLLKTSMYIEQAVVVGEKKNFMSALIVPDFDRLKEIAAQRNITYKDTGDLIKNDEIKNIFDRELKSFSKKLASHERIRRYRLLNTEFSVESGELTPTLKVKRRVIESKYKDLINSIYDEER
ncbi:MAG TPA: AMP-dependent synthetase/ligase [Balneolales bacterium]|nr:AMP-dependent synthetase/ligase [Balneolales bacterium]